MQQREEASSKERVGKLKAFVLCMNGLMKKTIFSSSVKTTPCKIISSMHITCLLRLTFCALFCDEKMKVCADAK